jgi:hypothetical protein
MKLFALVLTFAISTQAFAARDAASKATNTIAKQALAVLSLKSDDDRFTQMCALLKSKLESNYIAGVWLGRYAGMPSDSAGEAAFRKMIPSIVMTKVVQALGNNPISGNVSIGQQSTSRGGGVFDVPVTVSSSTKSYHGTAVMKQTGSKFRLQDARYLVIDAVNYLKSEYQDILDEEAATTNKPITAMVARLKAQPEFLDCH